jgi:hypothetical protein
LNFFGLAAVAASQPDAYQGVPWFANPRILIFGFLAVLYVMRIFTRRRMRQ